MDFDIAVKDHTCQLPQLDRRQGWTPVEKGLEFPLSCAPALSKFEEGYPGITIFLIPIINFDIDR
jgi:hypothetical protein